jgi:hypothetical protein
MFINTYHYENQHSRQQNKQIFLHFHLDQSNIQLFDEVYRIKLKIHKNN